MYKDSRITWDGNLSKNQTSFYFSECQFDFELIYKFKIQMKDRIEKRKKNNKCQIMVGKHVYDYQLSVFNEVDHNLKYLIYTYVFTDEQQMKDYVAFENKLMRASKIKNLLK